MKSLKSLLIASSLATLTTMGAVVAPTGSAMAAPISIDDISRHPLLSSVSLSPDGKHLAALVPVEGKRWPVISVWKTDDMAAKPVWIPTREMRYLNVSFLTNDKLIFVTDQPLTIRGKEDFTVKVFIADIDGTNIEEPMRQQGTLNDLERNVAARANTVGVVYNERDNDDFALIQKWNEVHRLDKKTFKTKRVGQEGTDWNYIFALTHPKTGDILGRSILTNRGGDFWVKTDLRADADSPWESHPALDDKLKERQAVGIVGFDGSPDKLVVLSNRGEELIEAFSYDVRKKSFDPDPIFSNPKYDVTNVILGKPNSNGFEQPIGAVVAAGGREVIYTDPYWKSVKAGLDQQFPKMDISIGQRSDSNKMAIISVSDERTPPSYFIWKDDSLVPLGNSRPWIDPENAGTDRWISYTARDGLKIPAILTLPPGYTRDQGRIPLVVHPHGGPWARDYMGWDQSGWTQFLSSRGVAVIRPQYRGSTNLGKTLWYAGDMEWGQKMQDDKDDGAQFLVDQGIADPNKMAIFGYSYGGFAAIAASVRPNSPYQCAISGAGVSSLDRIGNLWGQNRINRERQAWTVKGMDPLKNVEKANIPILLYHGSGDRQADTVHSRDFYKAMKGAGKDVEYIEIDTMWHTLPWWPEWHDESLTAIERYLGSDKCNFILDVNRPS